MVSHQHECRSSSFKYSVIPTTGIFIDEIMSLVISLKMSLDTLCTFLAGLIKKCVRKIKLFGEKH